MLYQLSCLNGPGLFLLLLLFWIPPSGESIIWYNLSLLPALNAVQCLELLWSRKGRQLIQHEDLASAHRAVSEERASGPLVASLEQLSQPHPLPTSVLLCGSNKPL